MGGHGGLNILPQKRWNVYRFDNMEKVRKDEEAAAKEEQLKREQARKRDAEFRMEKLRTAKGLEPLVKQKVEESNSELAPAAAVVDECAVAVEERKVDSKHINLFEGIKIFDIAEKVKKKVEREDERPKKKRKEEPVRVVTAEDEKYRLGYGVAGKGVKLPWYMSKPNGSEHDQDLSRSHDRSNKQKDKSKSSGKKSLEELREERLAREKREKARERALLASGRDRPVPEDRYYRR